jgi:hypothetical protein
MLPSESGVSPIVSIIERINSIALSRRSGSYVTGS